MARGLNVFDVQVEGEAVRFAFTSQLATRLPPIDLPHRRPATSSACISSRQCGRQGLGRAHASGQFQAQYCRILAGTPVWLAGTPLWLEGVLASVVSVESLEFGEYVAIYPSVYQDQAHTRDPATQRPHISTVTESLCSCVTANRPYCCGSVEPRLHKTATA